MESDGSEAEEQKKKAEGTAQRSRSRSSQDRADKKQAPDEVPTSEERGNQPAVEAERPDGEEKANDNSEQNDDQLKEQQELDAGKKDATPAQKGKDVVSRVTKKWSEYVKERQDTGEESFASDRLSASSEYRKFIKEQDLGLDSGETVPSFTQVWMEMNSSKLELKASTKKAESSKTSKTSEGRARLTAAAAQPNPPKWFSARESLELLARGLEKLYKNIGDEEIPNGSKVIDAMKSCDREFAARQTPFERLGELLQVVHDDGWIQLNRQKNGQTLRILELPKKGVEHLVGDWDEKYEAREEARSREEKEGRSVRIVSADENRSFKESREDGNGSRPPPDPDADPLAEFAAEASATYRGESSTALALRQDSQERDRGESSTALALMGKRDRDERDDGRGDSTPRFTLSAPSNKLSRTESLKVFEDALKDLCSIGLPYELPLNASVVASHLRKKFSHFQISQTPFDRFSDLVEEAASQGVIKTTRAGVGRRDHAITWVKYRYRVLNSRRRERPSGGGSGKRRRTSRSRRQASGHRHRGGPARERGRRSRSGGRERRERRGGGEGRERRGGERRGERRAAAPESRGAQNSGKRDRDSKIASKKERESKRADKSKDKLKDAEKDKDKEKAKRREKDREKEKDKVKEREKEKEKTKEKRKDKEKEKAKDKEKEDKDKQKEKKRSRESESSSYEYYSYYSGDQDEYEEEDEESSSSSESSAKPERPAKSQKR